MDMFAKAIFASEFLFCQQCVIAGKLHRVYWLKDLGLHPSVRQFGMPPRLSIASTAVRYRTVFQSAEYESPSRSIFTKNCVLSQLERTVIALTEV
jgi:hypothetical protein